jgi:hypothetical protein
MFVRIARSPRFALGVAAAVILAGTALARTATAFNPQPDPPFGMVGIAQGQTARLNLVNAGSPTAALVPPPCRARLRFLDADGNVLARVGAEVEAGHSTFLDYALPTVPVNGIGDAVAPLRAEIRAAVHFVDDEIPPPCRVSLEIFDNATGHTGVLYAPPCRGAACAAGQ